MPFIPPVVHLYGRLESEALFRCRRAFITVTIIVTLLTNRHHPWNFIIGFDTMGPITTSAQRARPPPWGTRARECTRIGRRRSVRAHIHARQTRCKRRARHTSCMRSRLLPHLTQRLALLPHPCKCHATHKCLISPDRTLARALQAGLARHMHLSRPSPA